jgi:hypothetical protein
MIPFGHLATVGSVKKSANMRQSLVCEECGRKADRKAIGWRGYLVVAEEDEDEDEDEVLIFCSTCAAREFISR